MVFGRKGLFGNSGGRMRARLRVPFEPEGSVKSVRNAVARGTGPIPLNDIISAIRRSEREHGRDALTNLERWLLEVYNLEAYAIHQGGFDYYFAHVDGSGPWADASAALYAMERNDAAAVMRQAVELFLSHDHDSGDQRLTRSYLDKIDSLDRTFAALMPDFEASLAGFADQFYPYADRI